MDDARDNGGTGRPQGKPFDPRPYLRRIRVRGQEAEYLDVKWRLAWLRTDHPDARVATELVDLRDDMAIFRATVEVPSGGSASGYGSETQSDFPDFIEKAETKAIGRALAALGYGTQFALDFDLEEETPDESVRPIADAPVERAQPERERPRIREVPRWESGPGAEAQAEPESVPEQAPPPAAPQARAQAEEFNRADFSWNEFWHWARGLGYRNKSELEQLLGVDDLLKGTPREAREMLIAYRREQGLDV